MAAIVMMNGDPQPVSEWYEDGIRWWVNECRVRWLSTHLDRLQWTPADLAAELQSSGSDAVHSWLSRKRNIPEFRMIRITDIIRKNRQLASGSFIKIDPDPFENLPTMLRQARIAGYINVLAQLAIASGRQQQIGPRAVAVLLAMTSELGAKFRALDRSPEQDAVAQRILHDAEQLYADWELHNLTSEGKVQLALGSRQPLGNHDSITHETFVSSSDISKLVATWGEFWIEILDSLPDIPDEVDSHNAAESEADLS